MDDLKRAADQLKSSRKGKLNRDQFLNGNEAPMVASDEVLKLVQKFIDMKSIIDDPSTGLNVWVQPNLNPPGCLMRFKNMHLRITSTEFQSHHPNDDLSGPDGYVWIELFMAEGHHGVNYEKENIENTKLRFDVDESGNYGWSDHEEGHGFSSTEEVVKVWGKKFIDLLEEAE